MLLREVRQVVAPVQQNASPAMADPFRERSLNAALPVLAFLNQRNMRKKSRMSAVSSSGTSSAAKCPPRLKRDQ